MDMPLDRAAEKVAALGVPGVVLVVVMAISGHYGGAAIIWSLAALGGPLGMLGGIALLGILALVSDALSRWGVDAFLRAVLRRLKETGYAKEDILKKISGYWFLSKSRRDAIRRYIDELYPRDDDNDGAALLRRSE